MATLKGIDTISENRSSTSFQLGILHSRTRCQKTIPCGVYSAGENSVASRSLSPQHRTLIPDSGIFSAVHARRKNGLKYFEGWEAA